MDLVPLIDRVGEVETALIGGAALGVAFGFFAQRSHFCTRSAVLDLTRGRDMSALAIWLAGFAIAVLGVQLLIATGQADVAGSRFFASAQSLSGALIGGLAFGCGMVLTRGCASRLVVLSASGNLRAVFSIVVVASVALAVFSGPLVPLRTAITGIWSTGAPGGNDLVARLGFGPFSGVALGIVLAVAALAVAVRARASPSRFVGGALVGATIVAGWYFTAALATQVFEPIQPESLTFVRPLATTGALALGAERVFGFDQGLLFGSLAGAFAAAVLSGEFRIATFSEPGTPSVLRYATGAALMGFGGLIAAGCTIGAGFGGGSALALASLAALAAIVLGAAVTDRVVDRKSGHDAAAGSAQPAQ